MLTLTEQGANANTESKELMLTLIGQTLIITELGANVRVTRFEFVKKRTVLCFIISNKNIEGDF